MLEIITKLFRRTKFDIDAVVQNNRRILEDKRRRARQNVRAYDVTGGLPRVRTSSPWGRMIPIPIIIIRAAVLYSRIDGICRKDALPVKPELSRR